MDIIVDYALHLDQHLAALVIQYGVWIYALLFAIVFAETGLVVTPFLPGDSLLFAAGTLAAVGALDLSALLALLSLAAIVGDAVNYAIGKRLGPAVFKSEKSKLLNREHLMKAHAFYEKHGGKTIIIARFIPIIRTFAPFVAGIGSMTYARFAAYNVIGAVVWVWSFLFLGYQFGNLPVVKKNFTLVILGIIVVSCLPAVYEFIKARREGKKTGTGFDVVEATTVGEDTKDV